MLKRKLSKSTGVPSPLAPPGYSPLWTPSTQVLAQKLWLPAIDNITSSVWHGDRSSTLAQKTWFTTQAMVTRSAHVTEFVARVKESDVGEPPPKKARVTKTDKAPAGKSKRIRVYPTTMQRVLLNQWFGAARWTYNQCLQHVERDNTLLKKKELRSLVVNNDCHIGKPTAWALQTPYEVRDAAMVDLVNTYTTNFAKMKKNKTKFQFRPSFRSRKDAQEAIMIRGKSFKNGVFYPSFFGKEPLRSSELLPEKVDYDCKLVRNRLGQYFLCIPQPLVLKSDNQALQRVAALDPGVRTFQTIYDPDGRVLEFGKNDFGRIVRLCHYLDDLVSRTSKAKEHKQRWRMRRAAMRMRLRIRNIVDECHKKLVTFLLNEYDVILLPSFETSKMAPTKGRKNRVLSAKSVRAMLTWSHYRFKQRLLFKQQEYPRCKVLIVDESYTTQTCGHCGKLNKNIGSKKTFTCPSCHVVMDRDANAARNILLKNESLLDYQVGEALGLTPSQ